MINAVAFVVFIEREITLVHFAIPFDTAVIQPVAVGNRDIGLEHARYHNGVMSAVADQVAHLDLADVVVTLPVVGMNAEYVKAELDGKAVALACPVEIIAALVTVTVGAGGVGEAVGIVYVGRGLVPVFACGKLFAQHIQSCGDVNGIFRIIGVGEINPSCLAAVSGLAVFAAHGSDVEARVERY